MTECIHYLPRSHFCCICSLYCTARTVFIMIVPVYPVLNGSSPHRTAKQLFVPIYSILCWEKPMWLLRTINTRYGEMYVRGYDLCCCTSIARILGQESKGRCIFTHSSFKIWIERVFIVNNFMRVSSSSAQWQTAHAVAGHSGQDCDMAPLSGTPRAAEPNGKTARTVARHSGDVCDQVPMARSRSSNHGAELGYHTEMIFVVDILRLSRSFLW